jgi:ABC-type uncharacterized transport system substrate-binding protein
MTTTIRRRSLLAWGALAPAGLAWAAAPPKVLHVMSYHSPWRWTDGQLEGFRDGLDGLPVNLRVLQMNTKQNSTEAAKQRIGAEMRAAIDQWQPDLLYTSDDDAQAYVARHYVGTRLPIVFSGVNAEPSQYGFRGAPNVAGVQEHEHFVESVRLLRAMGLPVRTIAVVVDDAPMWDPVLTRMRAALPQADVRVAHWDCIRTWDEYKQRTAAYQGKVDAVGLLGIFNFKDGARGNVPYREVLRWTAEHSRVPDFSYWLDRINYGTLASVTVSEQEQGRAAGRLARAILADGRAPGSLPMGPTVKGTPMVSLARARRLALDIPSSVLLSSEVVTRFDWEVSPA